MTVNKRKQLFDENKTFKKIKESVDK